MSILNPALLHELLPVEVLLPGLTSMMRPARYALGGRQARHGRLRVRGRLGSKNRPALLRGALVGAGQARAMGVVWRRLCVRGLGEKSGIRCGLRAYIEAVV
jgi:hypothetical protein